MTTQPTPNPSSMLRWALGGNALFSTLTGTASLIAPEAIGTFLGLPAGEISALGSELLLFAGFLFFLVTRKDLERPWIRNSVLAVIAPLFARVIATQSVSPASM